MQHGYLIALGSNRRSRYGPPAATIRAALGQLKRFGDLPCVSRIVHTAPLGPSRRRYANAAATLRSHIGPLDLLTELKAIERAFGRRRGRRWGDRVLDLDLILWSGGRFDTPHLTIPHPAFRLRPFVLTPAAETAPDWRDPVTSLTLRQLVSTRGRAQAA